MATATGHLLATCDEPPQVDEDERRAALERLRERLKLELAIVRVELDEA